MVSKASKDKSTLPLYEEDYLLRNIGRLASDPASALTELVANAFDAGASFVDVIIPATKHGTLAVIDDGHGMTSEQFHARWMKMGYNRVKHQGLFAEFPKYAGEKTTKRRAYGRNGIGRHSLLCFADQYVVETWRDGAGTRFEIGTESSEVPFRISKETYLKGNGRGTKLTVVVERHLPEADAIREILSARFLHDPQFSIKVNGESIALADLPGLIERQELRISETDVADAYVIDTTKASASAKYQGIAFWITNRLVGSPSWSVGNNVLLDRRSRFAKRYSVVIKSNDFYSDIEPDWSRFKDSENTRKLFAAVTDYVASVIRKLSSSLASEASEDALMRNRQEFEDLPPLARIEVAHFTEELVSQTPTIHPDTLALAVQAVINLEKSRHGASLLEKLTTLEDEDVSGLNMLLSEWSVRDALNVLDEIDRRLEVIVAIEKLSLDPNVDEVHTLHPLVTQARWVFGPEFDSNEFSSNVTLRTAVRQVLGKETQEEDFLNHLKRPDLMILGDSTFSVVGTDEIDPEEPTLSRLKNILIIELKRGGFPIGRKEMDQAGGYIEDLLHCGHLDGEPYIRAYVVGFKVTDKLERKRTIGDRKHLVEALSFNQLVRTANARLFKLREKIPAKYDQLTGNDLAARILNLPKQEKLLKPEDEPKQLRAPVDETGITTE